MEFLVEPICEDCNTEKQAENAICTVDVDCVECDSMCVTDWG